MGGNSTCSNSAPSSPGSPTVSHSGSPGPPSPPAEVSTPTPPLPPHLGPSDEHPPIPPGASLKMATLSSTAHKPAPPPSPGPDSDVHPRRTRSHSPESRPEAESGLRRGFIKQGTVSKRQNQASHFALRCNVMVNLNFGPEGVALAAGIKRC
jgi:hypothetical protein